MAQSIHDFHDDPRNANIRIWINGTLKSRAEATVSVFDSGFVLGDGVWEGLRVIDGHPVFLDEHLDRLFEEVIAGKSLSIEHFRAPLLPVPKSRWDGLVYLHGLLSAAPTAGELDRLVVSSGDFGLAYLMQCA